MRAVSSFQFPVARCLLAEETRRKRWTNGASSKFYRMYIGGLPPITFSVIRERQLVREEEPPLPIPLPPNSVLIVSFSQSPPKVSFSARICTQLLSCSSIKEAFFDVEIYQDCNHNFTDNIALYTSSTKPLQFKTRCLKVSRRREVAA